MPCSPPRPPPGAGYLAAAGGMCALSGEGGGSGSGWKPGNVDSQPAPVPVRREGVMENVADRP